MIKRIVGFSLLFLMAAGLLYANPSLRELSGELAAKYEGESVVEGADGWLFLRDELVHLSKGRFWGEDAAKVSRTKKKEFADPIPAIASYNKALAEQGITLYLMPVPPKALIYTDKLKEGVSPGGVDEERKIYDDFYTELSKQGVEVINLLPQLVENAKQKNVYCKTDTHFSPAGLTLFASEASKVLQKQDWYEAIPKQEYSKKDQIISITGDLSQMVGKNGTEELKVSLVSTATGGSVESNEKSPVILLGDSHTLVFSAGSDLHSKSAGLFDHLSAELGFPIDLLGVRGSGITPARVKLFQRSKKNPDYLKGKKALIWCFTAREFTGKGGWREIPVLKK